MTCGGKNHPHDKAKNRPHDDSKNRPNIINPVPLFGVVDEDGLKALLIAGKQQAWCSRVRILGLLLLIDYLCRNLKQSGDISISADLARSFVSKLRNRSCAASITEPLLLLCHIGMLQRVRPAVFAHIKTSAVYCFTHTYRRGRLTLRVLLPPNLTRKRKSAKERFANRLNHKYPFRKQLLADLATVSFLPSGRPIVARGLAGKNSQNLCALVAAIDNSSHFVRVSERGQITTSLGSCPRELKSYLRLNGEPIVSCDISNAHWNFLPLILATRLDFVANSPRRHRYVNEGWREHNRLVALLGSGDFYRQYCVDPKDDEERAGKKTILNILLNSTNDVCEENFLYRTIRLHFPITFRVIEDIKRNDRRNLSKQLHRFTADAVEGALLTVQREGISAIPHVDALICQEKNYMRVCEALGKQVFEATGVCPIVGSIRYSPLTEIEKQALVFDEEIALPGQEISYEDWEAMRLLKCQAALKLMRRG